MYYYCNTEGNVRKVPTNWADGSERRADGDKPAALPFTLSYSQYRHKTRVKPPFSRRGTSGAKGCVILVRLALDSKRRICL
ncbi:hypothetical protein SRHO_G00047130 [Serrasalmus rhombeus]